jgi:hypothetical protein
MSTHMTRTQYETQRGQRGQTLTHRHGKKLQPIIVLAQF